MARNHVDPDSIIEILIKKSGISKSDLATESELSKPAITAFCKTLSSAGVLSEKSGVMTRSGRRAKGIALDLSYFRVLVIRLNRYWIEYVDFDGNGEMLNSCKTQLLVESKIESIMEDVKFHITRFVEIFDAHRCLGVSISTLGWVVSTGLDTFLHVDGFSELNKIDILRTLRNAFPDLTIVLEHDAKAAALAEYKQYVEEFGIEPECLVNIVGGIGFGAGIVINGRIFHGSQGIAGELGHLGINFNSSLNSRVIDRPEFCGLFEDYASPRAMKGYVADRLIDFPDTELFESSSFDEIIAAYGRGDGLASWVLNHSLKFFAYGLAGMVYLLNPDVIVLSDELSKLKGVTEVLSSELKLLLPPVISNSLEIRLSSSGSNAVLLGSYQRLIQELLERKVFFSKICYGKD